MQEPDLHYLHIAYVPEAGWVLSMMARLKESNAPQLQKAFQNWSNTKLVELGIAITTRMAILARCIRRLNGRVAELRRDLSADAEKLEFCLSKGYAFDLRDKDLAYELLLDMDSFIFETRSLYELVGAFLRELFTVLFNRKITEDELKSVLTKDGIDTRWIEELQQNRILFFHNTAPWLGVEVRDGKEFDPVLLKKNIKTFENPDDFVRFRVLRGESVMAKIEE